MSSIDTSCLGGLSVSDSVNDEIMVEAAEAGMFSPNAFGDLFGDDQLNDGNDELLAGAMNQLYDQITVNQEERQRQADMDRIHVISDVVVREANQPRKVCKLEKLLTIPERVKSKRAFYEKIHHPSPKRSKGKTTPPAPININNVEVQVEDGPGGLSPPTPRRVEVPVPVYSLISPASCEVRETNDRPLSPIIGSGGKRKSAGKAVKAKRSAIVKSASTSSSQPDWSEFSTSQAETFSKARNKFHLLREERTRECCALEKFEKDAAELQQAEAQMQQALAEIRKKLCEVKNNIKNSKSVIDKCDNKLLIVEKTFNFSDK